MQIEKQNKIVIIRRQAYRWEGIEAGAKKLGVTSQALRMYLCGRRSSIGPAKRALIVVKTEEC